MEKFIHIHAKCKAFEIHEQVPEKRSVRRLISIKKYFEWFSNREGYAGDRLVVNTRMVNPEIMFR